MITGAALATLVARSASSVLGRIAGGPAASKWNQIRLERNLEKAFALQRDDRSIDTYLNSTSATQLAELEEYLDSSEISRAIERYCYSRFLSSKSRKREEASVETEVFQRVRMKLMALPKETAEGIATAVFSHIQQIVAEYLLETNLSGCLPKDILAQSMLQSAKIAIASERSTASFLKTQISYRKISDFREEIAQRVQAVHGKIKVPSSGSNQLVNLDELYVAPRSLQSLVLASDAQALPRRRAVTSTSGDAKVAWHRLVLLGDPGGGKSTFAKSVALRAAQDYFEGELDYTPFLVVLRDISADMNRQALSIAQHIANICAEIYQVAGSRDIIEYLLSNGQAVVVLDGLDELVDPALRSRLVDAIHAFASAYPDSPILVTSRRIGYGEAPLDYEIFKTRQLEPFSRAEVSEYALKWFTVNARNEEHPGDPHLRARAFLRESELAPDIRNNPLMLALMCGLYSAENYIPKNRPDLYARCSLLLFQKWDRDRSILMELPFSAHILPAISSMAYWMHGRPNADDGVKRSEVVSYIADYLHERKFSDFDEAWEASQSFISFCTGRAWVLTDLGLTRGESRYGFTHRTFLEYFAARQIVRDNPSAEALFEFLLPRIERAELDIVAQIAIQVLDEFLDGSASDVVQLAADRARGMEPSSAAARNLISFAARSCSYIELRHGAIWSVCEACFNELRLSESSIGLDRANPQLPAVYDLVCALRENLGEICRYTIALISRLKEVNEHRGACAMALFPVAFARRNRSAFNEIHLEFWTREAERLRAAMMPLVESSLKVAAPRQPQWITHFAISRSDRSRYMSNRGLSVPLTRSINRVAFQSVTEGNLPQYVSHPPLAIGLLGAILSCERLARSRDEVEIRGILSGDVAHELSIALFNLPKPWSAFRNDGTSTIPEPHETAVAALWAEPAMNDLYVALTAFCVDYSICARAARGDGRNPADLQLSDVRDYWHEVTGGVFSGRNLIECPISIHARNFVDLWLNSGQRLVCLAGIDLGRPATP